MRSLHEIIRLAQAEDFTRENAQAIVKEQVDEMVSILHYEPAEARRLMLVNIGYFCGYYPADLADKVYELFETEHPILGKTHPPAREIFRIGMEMGKRLKDELEVEVKKGES